MAERFRMLARKLGFKIIGVQSSLSIVAIDPATIQKGNSMFGKYSLKAYLIAFVVCGVSFMPRAYADGIGMKAGPFHIHLEAPEVVDDVVVTLSNLHLGGEGNIHPGGAYHKITVGSTTSAIVFPRDWMYDWKFAGKSGVHGLVLNPKYITMEITASLRENDTIEVIVSNSILGEPEIYNVPNDSPVHITVRMTSVAEFLEIAADHWEEKTHFPYLSNWSELSQEERRFAVKAFHWDSHRFVGDYFRLFKRLGMLPNKVKQYASFYTEMDKKYFPYLRRYGRHESEEYFSSLLSSEYKKPEYEYEIFHQK